jgi:valyl-tRNA synthetase
MLENRYNYENEKKWQNFWQENKIYAFDEKSVKPVFSIDTPPPTVSGHIHLGHIFSYTQADFIARFKSKNGFNVFFPFGYDNNGLPTELYTEKKHGVKGRNMARADFAKLCLDTIDETNKIYKDTYIKVGYSADFNKDYSTISKDVQKISQQSFLDFYKNGNLTYGEKPANWCCDCQTSVAAAELEDKNLPSIFNFMKWEIEGGSQIEIATTRPELLCACLAVFVNPKDKRYTKLIGKNVTVPLYNFTVKILADDLVDIEKGSGAVMCCSFGDQTDVLWVRKHNLTAKTAFYDYGKMTALSGKYENQSIVECRKNIINDLKEAGVIFKQVDINHTVKVHERCGKPVEIKQKKQWFVKTQDIQKQLLEQGEKINWNPSHLKQIYVDWVKNLNQDWCISRQRFFGIPIPAFYCKGCGDVLLPKSTDLPIDPLNATLLKCKCGGEVVPEKDTFDTWWTSGSTPQIATSKLNVKSSTSKETKTNKQQNKNLPMSLRFNAREIIRTWDFYTIVKSFYEEKNIPWNDLMLLGWATSGGDKISKSKNNEKLNLESALKNYSADGIRYWATTGGAIGRDVEVNEENFKQSGRFLTKLWNAAKFVSTFINETENEKFLKQMQKKPDERLLNNLMPFDIWIIESYNKMITEFKQVMKTYEVAYSREVAEKFFWNFCDNYLEIVKNRLYKPEIYGEEEKKSGLITLSIVFKELLNIFSIFVPHITEEIYQDLYKNLNAEKSITKLDLNEIELIKFVDSKELKKTHEDCQNALEIIESVRAHKAKLNISIKEEINQIETIGYNLTDRITADLKAVLNIKNIVVKSGDKKDVRF